MGMRRPAEDTAVDPAWGAHKNDAHVATILRFNSPDEFDQLAALSPEELEALRTIAGRGSFTWAVLTTVLTYVEHGKPPLYFKGRRS